MCVDWRCPKFPGRNRAGSVFFSVYLEKLPELRCQNLGYKKFLSQRISSASARHHDNYFPCVANTQRRSSIQESGGEDFAIPMFRLTGAVPLTQWRVDRRGNLDLGY